MKKILLAAVGMTGLLASCSDVNIDGSTAEIDSIKTEYRTSSGQYVGCDATNTGSTKTQVAVYFTASGVVSSVKVQLKGTTNSSSDGNFIGTATGAELSNLGTSRFKFAFDADSYSNMLPASITVNPIARTVKIVNVSSANKVGSFYADLTLTTPDGQGTATSQFMSGGTIPVYSACTVTSTTTETL